MWQEIGASVLAEFSDLHDVRRIVQIIVRLLFAAALGGVLGFERERSGKAAGVRTHMLVALGATLLVAVPAQSGMAMQDLSRVLQGIITGVGFLGAGAILKSNGQEQIHGLTTAAGIWLTAVVGIAIGLGREVSALLGTILALIVLAVLPRLVHQAPQK